MGDGGDGGDGGEGDVVTDLPFLRRDCVDSSIQH